MGSDFTCPRWAIKHNLSLLFQDVKVLFYQWLFNHQKFTQVVSVVVVIVIVSKYQMHIFLFLKTYNASRSVIYRARFWASIHTRRPPSHKCTVSTMQLLEPCSYHIHFIICFVHSSLHRANSTTFIFFKLSSMSAASLSQNKIPPAFCVVCLIWSAVRDRRGTRMCFVG
jgi:hypothetical protein